MPSLRQPVGPLPASIYWRRRLVVLVALAVVAALVIWLLTGSGDGGGQGQKKTSQAAPVQSITPGASPSGSAITSRPGGTGGTGGGAAAAGGTGASGGDVSLSTGGTGGGSSDGAGSTAGGTDGSAAGGTGSGTGGGQPPTNTPDVMALPACAASQVSLELASGLNSYTVQVKPRFSLTVRNTSDTGCRVDLGRTASTLTVTASNGERVWSSGDCPANRQATWVQLAAGAGLTENFTWSRNRSKPQCASADGTAAGAGNYLVQAALAGPAGGPVSARTSIRLED
ncbi:hypothetical protein AB0442_01200 [Kitasatospora sp. NPDC085895]|uniref:hypothetical protein n=1 Tax=Kitasatospora sp. NPDC085895 TaxID=3155057 RepID=UPI00344D6942